MDTDKYFREALKKGKILLNVEYIDKCHNLSSKFEYKHILCGGVSKGKLFEILYHYNCPHCDKALLEQKTNTGKVEEILKMLEEMQNNRDVYRRYSDEMFNIFYMLPGLIASIERVKNLPGSEDVILKSEVIQAILSKKSEV